MKPRNAMSEIREYILASVARGELAPGQKLPPERELAERFQTSRAAVRQTLTILESEKRVHRHIGRGTFIADSADQSTALESGSGVDKGLNDSVRQLDTSPAELMEARFVVEPHIAELVVLNATESDLARLRQLCECQKDLADASGFEESDIHFHRVLAEATHNEVLIATSELIINARQNPEWHKLKKASRIRNQGRGADATAEHLGVVEALEARDTAAACQSMRVHLANIRSNLLGY